MATQCETVVWAYGDMEAARRLWPRVKTAVEEQCASESIRLDLATQRRVIAATVSDLLAKSKPGKRIWHAPKSIGELLRMLRKPDARAA